MISQQSNKQRVINFTLVSQHGTDVKFGRLAESRSFHKTTGAVKCACVCARVCVCLRMHAYVHQRQGWVYLPSGSGASHPALPVPVCCIRTGSWIRITALTKQHQK